MSAILIYSQRCKHSISALKVIQANKALHPIISFHDVNIKPIPPQMKSKITHVPTLITKDGKIMSGKEVITWLNSMIPSEFSGVDSNSGGLFTSNLDGSDEGPGSYFSMDSYGESLKPEMTEDLKKKIDMDVSEAYNVRNNK